jgi:catechol 2,3-dioxygenase-like lactoylglutathione lyase family enzyme
MIIPTTPAHTAIRRIAVLALAAGLTSFAAAQAPPAPAPAAAPAPAVPVAQIPMNGIAHIAIRVKDLATSVAFYNKLGYQQAFAMTRGDVTTQSFVKIDDRQFIEIYPMSPRDTEPGFMHLCFEGADLNQLHDAYVAEGLTPISVRKAAAGNLLFTLKGLDQYSVPQNIEYTEYMPGSLHSKDFGQHLGPDRVADKMTVVALAMKDPPAARAFYIDKLGFTPASNSPDRLNLPGTSGEQVEIVPLDPLGVRSSILLTTHDLNKSEAQLKRQQVAYQRASASATDAKGKMRKIDMISVTDPDGNIIRIQQQ